MLKNNLEVPLAYFRLKSSYKPKIGDLIIWHGWFTHWFGIVNGINDHKIMVIYAGIPNLLFTMSEDEYENNSKSISIKSIKSNRNYNILQDGIWYV